MTGQHFPQEGLPDTISMSDIYLLLLQMYALTTRRTVTLLSV
jgi:hypothetical protein